MSTVIAPVNMSSEFSGTTNFDSMHCPPLLKVCGCSKFMAICFSIFAEYICDFQICSSHYKQGNYISGRVSRGLVVAFKFWTAICVYTALKNQTFIRIPRSGLVQMSLPNQWEKYLTFTKARFLVLLNFYR